ncbi:hypothetical protein AB0P21_20920 [Kribbella sp. NPDC056861]|uniref:hypothetical protein n=1 Tax=Kribbella sp. NPDC056861 TaxID=3154857 RepID=UPI00343AD35B
MLTFEDDLPSGWRYWGLGPLVKEAFARGLIEQPLRDALDEINQIRKVSAHFKPPLEPDSLTLRAIERTRAAPDLQHEEAIDEVAQADALLALQTATTLLLGDQGYARSGW